jgi:hypothetical protein
MGGVKTQHHAFLISALQGDDQFHAPAALPPRKSPIKWEAGWITEPFWTLRIREKSLAPTWNRAPDRPARSLLTIPAR